MYARSVSFSIMVLATIAALLSTFFAPNAFGRTRLAPAGADSPSLSGQAAVDRLRQRGLYASLGDAVEKARSAARASSSPTAGPLLAQTARLTHGAGDADDLFGTSVAVFGDRAIVGAPEVSLGAGAGQGQAYVFVLVDGEWTLEDTLVPRTPIAGSLFGTSVAMFRDRAIVGAPSEDDGANTRQGAVYTFTRSGSAWTQEQRLVASDAASGDLFGISVDLEEDTAVVGASSGDSDSRDNTGSVYVFGLDGGPNGAWSETQKLTPSDPEVGARFGVSAALDAGTLVVGASGKDFNGAAASDAGAAYVFALDGTTWVERQELLPNANAEDDLFGGDVAVSGETILVGASGDDTGSKPDQGSAFVFTESGGLWAQSQKLTAADASEGDRFGISVALAGDIAVIGASGDDVGVDGQGSVYLFSRVGSTFGEQARMFAAGGVAGDSLGVSVAIDDDTILVGAPLADVGDETDEGSAVVFTIAPALEQQSKLKASDGQTLDLFGHSVGVSGDTAVVGAPFDDVGANSDQGSIYVFDFDGTRWVEDAHLFANDGDEFDRFGSSVAVDGNTIVVGAPDDNVGGNFDQGSVYVFVRGAGGAWAQQDHLFAAGGAAGDDFGSAVAVDDERLVTGAPGRDLGATPNEGAAYVFHRSAGSWSEETRLVGSVGDAEDRFGSSVAIDGIRVAVGAPDDDIGGDANRGSAYVFKHNGFWNEEDRVQASDGESDDVFGCAVGLAGDMLIVGASGDDVDGRADQGSAYAFLRDGSSWTEQAHLVAADGVAGANLGVSVAASGDKALVGASHDTVDNVADQGSAYLFSRSGASWVERQKLSGSPAVAGDHVGNSVALKGDVAAIGAFNDSGGGSSARGAAYAFAIADCPRITIDPEALPDATAGEAYSWDITASGGVEPYNYAVASGALPSGITLDATTGRLEGTPATAGTYAFTITATDASLCTGNRDYTLAVGCRTITLRPVNPSLKAGRVGAAYTTTFTARGGATPYTFSVGAGALPAGLTLDAATGVLSGTPTEAGTFSFEVVATDAGGCSGLRGYVLTIR